jgi:hypothetical protein
MHSNKMEMVLYLLSCVKHFIRIAHIHKLIKPFRKINDVLQFNTGVKYPLIRDHPLFT